MIKDLIIPIPSNGIAPSPHRGFQDVRNLDVLTSPGVIRLNNLVAKKSGTTVVTGVQWMVSNPATPAEKYALDSAGKVYKSTDSGATWALMTGNTQTSAHGNGLAIYKNYLVVARDTLLDVCGDGTATGIANANWTNGWKTIDSDVLWHPMIISKNDNKLYGGAGKYVFSVDEVTAKTFAPSDGTTFTFTQQALDLPPNYRIKCLEELGNSLMCGTWMGTNVYDLRVAEIFPWDRSSASFGQPVTINENGVHAMINTGYGILVLAGIGGAIYITNGVSAYQVGQIPHAIANLDGGLYLEPMPGAITMYKGRPFFGVSSGGTSAMSGMGVYSLARTPYGIRKIAYYLVYEHTISTGNDGTSNYLKIGALLPVTRDTILIGWNDNGTYGIDGITNTSYATSYSGYFITPLYTVGTNKEPRKFTQVEFQLAKPLAANEGIKVEYRKDLSASFTTLGTYDFTTFGAEVSHNEPFSIPATDIPACEQVQFKISLTGTTTTPELKSVTFR